MTATINIQQVAKVLGRSTKSVRNYIKEGRLKAEKVPSPRGMEYQFDFGNVSDFAQKHLRISIEANIPPASTRTKKAGRPNGSATGVGEVTKLMTQFEKEKTDLLKELGELKAQAGYKIGQLESQVKLLEAAKEERDKLQQDFTDLDRQHKASKRELTGLRDMKAYYDKKRWWHILKGKYVPSRHTDTSETEDAS